MRANLELSLLGTVTITQNGTEIGEHISAKSQALLCCLAVTGCPHSQGKLADLLWGNKPDTSARANLRKSLSNLRQMFGDALIINRQTVAFNHDSDYWLDVEELMVKLTAVRPQKVLKRHKTEVAPALWKQ